MARIAFYDKQLTEMIQRTLYCWSCLHTFPASTIKHKHEVTYRISSNSFRGIYSFQVLPAAATKRGRLLLSSVKGKIIEWVIVVKEIPISTRNRKHTQIGYGSSRVRYGSAETNRGRTLNHWQKQTVQTLFEGGY